jgi:hypothetical protein
LEAFQRGTGYFNGTTRPAATLGRSAEEIFQCMLGYAVPDLYPKLGLITGITLKGGEPDEILKAASLNNLAPVFYEGDAGLGLVIKQGGKATINPAAPIAREIHDKMQADFAYGNKVTGRSLEDHFSGLGYGWDRDFVVLAVASLLRGGYIEMTYQGRRYRNHLEPQVRQVFSGANAFRAASFTPRKAPDLQTLVRAARSYEDLTGEEADVDEMAIAQAVQRFARAERDQLVALMALANAYQMGLAVTQTLTEYQTTLDEIVNGASDDVVNAMAGQGGSLKEIRARVQTIRAATDNAGLRRLSRLRIAVASLWPVLAERSALPSLADMMPKMKAWLEQGSYYVVPADVDRAVELLERVYRELYQARHAERSKVYKAAVDFVKGLEVWSQATAPDPGVEDPQSARAQKTQELQQGLLAPLMRRLCQGTTDNVALTADGLVCQTCNASIPELESDVDAVVILRDRIVLRLQELAAPQESFERVRVAELVGVGRALSTPEEVRDALKRLEDHLLKLIAGGIKVILE